MWEFKNVMQAASGNLMLLSERKKYQFSPIAMHVIYNVGNDVQLLNKIY